MWFKRKNYILNNSISYCINYLILVHKREKCRKWEIRLNIKYNIKDHEMGVVEAITIMKSVQSIKAHLGNYLLKYKIAIKCVLMLNDLHSIFRSCSNFRQFNPSVWYFSWFTLTVRLCFLTIKVKWSEKNVKLNNFNIHNYGHKKEPSYCFNCALIINLFLSWFVIWFLWIHGINQTFPSLFFEISGDKDQWK